MTKIFPQLLLAIITVFAFAFYYPSSLELWNTWQSIDEYSHGPMMLMIAVYYLYKRREMLSFPQTSGRLLGVIILLLGLGLFLMALKANIMSATHVSFLIVLLGGGMIAGGYRYASYLSVPLILVLFVIPPPYFLNANLSWRLQLLSTDVSVTALRFIGVSVFQNGNVIDLGLRQLEVAEACSGLRYLYPMLGLGVLVGFIFNTPWWKKILFVLCAAAIAVGINILRIFVIGVLVEYADLSVSDGFLHFFEGWVYFIISFVIMMGMCWMIMSSKERDSLGYTPKLPAIEKPQYLNLQTVYGAAGIIVVGGGLVITQWINGLTSVIPERESFQQFPRNYLGRQATTEIMPVLQQEILALDDYFLGTYEAKDKLPINLFVAYYKEQSAGRTPHSPRVCVPAGGWEIEKLDETEITINGVAFPVNRVIIKKGTFRQLLYYWFQQRGDEVANEYKAKLDLLVGSLTSRRTDGALIRWHIPVPDESKLDESEQELKEFISAAMQDMPRFVPK